MATYAAYRHVELDNVGYGKKRVLKPPGGGSSDIFGAPEETSPRRVKNHNQSQLGSALFGDGSTKNGSSSTGTTSPDSPRANKPGNDSYNRLFGPPDAPSIQNAKNHTRSNISLSGDSHDSRNEKIVSSNGHHPGTNNATAAINGNANTNDNTAFRRNKRFRGSSCMPRNPVTGDGVYVTPFRRSARKSRDGNPVTGTGYTSDAQNNVAPVQNGVSASNMNGSEKSSDTSPAGSTKGQASRARVPPGGYSSGLW